jgi:hypothetical protein
MKKLAEARKALLELEARLTRVSFDADLKKEIKNLERQYDDLSDKESWLMGKINSQYGSPEDREVLRKEFFQVRETKKNIFEELKKKRKGQ